MEDRMNCKRVWVCATLLLACAALAFAQDQANEIRCSGSGTTCKTNFFPKFASNGGTATVSDSIVSQSGTTITVAGSETVHGTINAGQGINSAVGPQIAVIGQTATGGVGVFGANATTTAGFGVQGAAFGSNGIGAAGSSNFFGAVSSSIIGTAPIGVIGDSANGYAVVAASDNSNALVAQTGSSDTSDTAVISNPGGGFPLFVGARSGSMFLDSAGDLNVSGAISAGRKDFKIDHPLDPGNKYLYHASVESSEMMNIYTGTALTDASGSASVSLPDWFEAVNGDFRYQLTAIGVPAPNLHIAQEISNNQFRIAGGQPGMKVSWQVTGVRHDAYAKAHPLEVSVDKPESERGYYIHPELYGAASEQSLASAHLAQVKQRAKRND
jgi:hypothetical protein